MEKEIKFIEKAERKGLALRDVVQSQLCANAISTSSRFGSIGLFAFMATVAAGFTVPTNAGQFELGWTDDSDNETGFRIERSVNGSDFELIGDVGPNIEVYYDGDLESGVTYYYRVYSFNAIGHSDYSEVVSATTPFLAPEISITSALDSSFHQGDDVLLTVSLDGDLSSLVAVEYYLNDALVSSVDAAPWSYAATGLETGQYELYAKTKTNNGEVSVSETKSFEVLSRIDYNTVSGDDVVLFSNNIGNVGVSSEVDVDTATGEIEIVAGGSDVWGTSDGFNYLWTAVEGNFEVSTQFHSLVETSAFAKAGIMIRQNLEAGSIHAFAHVNAKANSGVYLTNRKVENATTATTNLSGISGESMWLKLTRNDDVVSSYYSMNGTTWSLYASEEIAFSDDVYVGIAVASNNVSAATTAIFSEFDLKGENIAPTISVVSNQVVEQGGNVSGGFTIGDIDTDVSSLVVSISSDNVALLPSNGMVLSGEGANRSFELSPVESEYGTANVQLTVSDGRASASTSFVLTVEQGEDVAPTISAVADQVVEQGGNALGGFTIGDVDTDVSTLVVSISSDNAALLPSSSMVLKGEGANRSFELSPIASAYGAANVQLTVSDGRTSSSTSFVLTVERDVVINTQTVRAEALGNGDTRLSVEATGDNLAYQWYKGAAGDSSNPVVGGTGAELVISGLRSDAQYWVKVTSEGRILSGGSVNSETININYNPYPRYYFGEFSGGVSGEFALMENADRTGAFLGSIAGMNVSLKFDNLVIENDGLFSFSVDGVGEFVGEIADGEVSVGLVGTATVAVGIQDEVDTDSSAYSGLYTANMVNSADGEVVVITGPSGKAFVHTVVNGETVSGIASVDENGMIGSDLGADGRVDLELTDSFLIRGSSSFADVEFAVSGRSVDADESEHLVNTSMRAKAGEGASTMIAGFVISGEGTKQILIRGVGPALAAQNVTGEISDPKLYLYRYTPEGGFALYGSNDNWNSATNADEISRASEFAGAFALPTDGLDAAIKIDLPAGVYSAHLNGGTGTALVEIYDVDGLDDVPASNTTLANISMRGDIGSGENVVIAGFVVAGDVAKRYLVRSIGDELEAHGVAGTLEDPNIALYKMSVENGAELVASNDDWTERADLVNEVSGSVGAFELDPSSKSSALVVWLEPGVYTAIAGGPDGSKGVALVEVYEIP